MRRAARVDENQPGIVKALRKAGAVVLITSQLKNCFDILVYFRGQTFSMEIKDGNKPPSKRKLTEGESNFKEQIEAVGVAYHVAESIEEALAIIISN